MIKDNVIAAANPPIASIATYSPGIMEPVSALAEEIESKHILMQTMMKRKKVEYDGITYFKFYVIRLSFCCNPYQR